MKFSKKVLLKVVNLTLLMSAALFLFSAIKALPVMKAYVLPEGAEMLTGKVRVVNEEDGWKLYVGDTPFFVKGVCYNFTPIGEGGDYDLFACPHKPWLVDGPLMKKMGVNAVRFYKPSDNPEKTKRVIRDLHEKFGIRSALGHYLGFWDWPPPNYADPEFRQRIKAEVLEMVETYKDEDGILFWILGNENNYSFDRGIRDWSTDEIESLASSLERREAKARIYYSFVNEIAKAIKEIDPNHPVVMGNGELASIYIAKELCPDVDILGGIVYQGRSFGTYFSRLERNFGKPNVFIEFGADRYDSYREEESQDWQAFYIKLQWMEIEKNRTRQEGAGNSLGGFIFEWSDEWWKNNPHDRSSWSVHNTQGTWSNTAYYHDAKAGDNMNEEWFGIVGIDAGQEEGDHSKRRLTKTYYVLKSLWTKEDGRDFLYAVASGILLILSVGLFLVRRIVK